MNERELRELIEKNLPEGTTFEGMVEFVLGTLQDVPVEYKEELLTQEIVDEALLDARSELAKEDTPEGFREYTWCVTGYEMPLHVFYGWVVPTYYSHGNITWEQFQDYYNAEEAAPYRFYSRGIDKEYIGIVIYAARELAKTTYNTVLWTSFRIGQEPWKANMIVQIGDNSAKRNTAKIADIIERYAGFKRVFPNVEPDKESSWSANGYDVRDTSLTDNEWNKKISTRQDPTLAGYGYNSGVIIGKHPDGVLIVDDIHNETNTISQVELDKVLQIVQGTIFYAATDDTWITFVGTPWVDGDTLDFVSATGEYWVSKMPAYLEYNKENELSYPQKYLPETEKVYMWPEKRGEKWVGKKYRLTIEQEFKRMVLLNLTLDGGRIYTYYSFPQDEIDWSWKQKVGVDPVATVSIVQGVDAGVSWFAMVSGLWSAKHNALVIASAAVEKIDLEEGERRVTSWQRVYPQARFIIETNNAGAAFISMINRTPGMLWDGVKTSDIGGGSKEQRQYTFLQPVLKEGRVLISSEDTPGLNILRNYLNKFGRFKFRPDAPELDAGDALVLCVYGFPEVWIAMNTNPVSGRLNINQEQPEGLDALSKLVQDLNKGR